MSVKRGVTLYERMFNSVKHKVVRGVPKPPYDFTVQIGDPILRAKAQPVKKEDINTKEFQEIITTLYQVMSRNYAFGLAAPQIGIPLQMFITELPQKQMQHFSKEQISQHGILSWPLKVFINPKMTVLDNTPIIFQESCLSVNGFAADVSRFTKVKVEGLDERGEEHSWAVSHFPARVLQHEMDHLNGTMFVDTMNPKTFHFQLWKYVQEIPRTRKIYGGS